MYRDPLTGPIQDTQRSHVASRAAPPYNRCHAAARGQCSDENSDVDREALVSGRNEYRRSGLECQRHSVCGVALFLGSRHRKTGTNG